MKNKLKVILLFSIIVLSFSNITAVESNAKIEGNDSVEVGDTIEITLDFGTYIGAYDSYNIEYDEKLLELVSVDKELMPKYWYDNSQTQSGIKTVTYKFKALADGMAKVKFEVTGAVKTDEALTLLDDINLTKEIKVGTGVLKGDLNKDGIINSTDASIALDLYRNGNATEEDISIGDMDGNKIINSADASMILDAYKYN